MLRMRIFPIVFVGSDSCPSTTKVILKNSAVKISTKMKKVSTEASRFRLKRRGASWGSHDQMGVALPSNLKHDENLYKFHRNVEGDGDEEREKDEEGEEGKEARRRRACSVKRRRNPLEENPSENWDIRTGDREQTERSSLTWGNERYHAALVVPRLIQMDAPTAPEMHNKLWKTKM